MQNEELQNRLINIEMALDNQQKSIDDLSEVVIKQGKLLDYLLKQNEALKSIMEQDVVKPQSEETPPPHY
ncbi:MAG: SlyX family protein [Alphaproteobacteria bacterium]|nr:SlyX family protein [Alphaproteobacteria bacterium]